VVASALTKRKTHSKSVLFALVGTANFAVAGDVQFTSKIDTTIYVYDTERNNGESVSNEAIVVLPSILTSYSAKRATASFVVDHTKVEQNNDIDGANKNYTELKYNSVFTLIESAMTLSFSGAQNYRVINSQQQFVGDKLLSPGDLTKYRNNSAGLNFSIPNPKYLGFTFQSSFSETKTDESLDDVSSGLDSDNLGVSARLYNGKYARNYNFNLSAQYNDSSRSNFGDFSSSNVSGRIGFVIANKLDWVIVGSSENYDVGEGTFSRRNNIDTTSYGAGIEWKPRGAQAILLTYNQLEEGDIETKFVGVNVNWAFSNRTALKFDYAKRFYGDAYNADFTYALKSLRSSLSYSEQVTTFGQLANSGNNFNGLFVCEFGSTDLVDCFQPDSLDYELQAGEEFRASTDLDSDISEEVIFTKVGRFNIGYDKRKLKASVNLSYSKTEYLESDRLQKTRSVGLNLSYALGRKTNISLTSNLSKRQFDELSDEDTNRTVSLDFKRDLSKKLQVNVGVRLLDRESDNASRDLTDKRLTLGLNYTF
jgi:uncharacterized protein (PEP-CTERM system associated)